jgi:hypothetical protein
MPVVPKVMSKLMAVKAASTLMSGSKLPAIEAAISSAVCQYILSSAVVNSTNVAIGPGSGTQTGKIIGLIPTFMSKMMLLKAFSLGLTGKDLGKLLNAVSFGIVNGLKTAVLQGVIIGAGPGTGIGRITGLTPFVLQKLILAQEAFRAIAGSKSRDLASCVAFGACTYIKTFGIVVVTNIGVTSPPPVGPIPFPAAPGFGKLI